MWKMVVYVGKKKKRNEKEKGEEKITQSKKDLG